MHSQQQKHPSRRGIGNQNDIDVKAYAIESDGGRTSAGEEQ
jgi:hypothetical protein